MTFPRDTVEATASREPMPVQEKELANLLVCPETGQSLVREGNRLVTASRSHAYPIVREIPRFVSSDAYVGSFSYEWNLHPTTQLDSQRRSDSSEGVFRKKTGLSPDDVRGRLVLDAGIGAGRFTDVLLQWGARVVGVDLSYAVEAANCNFGHRSDVLICQADIGRLPFREGTFDFIVSIGVLHHTPDTRRYFNRLPRLLKPGGEIAIWLYPNDGDYRLRTAWTPFTGRLPKELFYRFCRVLVTHGQRHWDSRPVMLVRSLFPFSNQGLGLENDILDTYDAYSPRYHGVHSPTEVEGWFEEAGLCEIRHQEWNTAVRGRRPS